MQTPAQYRYVDYKTFYVNDTYHLFFCLFPRRPPAVSLNMLATERFVSGARAVIVLAVIVLCQRYRVLMLASILITITTRHSVRARTRCSARRPRCTLIVHRRFIPVCRRANASRRQIIMM